MEVLDKRGNRERNAAVALPTRLEQFGAEEVESIRILDKGAVGGLLLHNGDSGMAEMERMCLKEKYQNLH